MLAIWILSGTNVTVSRFCPDCTRIVHTGLAFNVRDSSDYDYEKQAVFYPLILLGLVIGHLTKDHVMPGECHVCEWL